MDSELIKKQLDSFQASVKKLSSEIGRASTIWKDDKFFELSSVVSDIANQSMEVIVSGDRACSSIERFNKIATEEY